MDIETKENLLSQMYRVQERVITRQWRTAEREVKALIEIVLAVSTNEDDTRRDYVRSSAPVFFGSSGYSGGCTLAAAQNVR